MTRQLKTDDVCGTSAGYNRHKDRGQIPCKPCREAQAAYLKDWRNKNEDHLKEFERQRYLRNGSRQSQLSLKDYKLRDRYGITTAQRDEIFEWQGSVCRCCGTAEDFGREKAWQIEHNHETETLRGIACPRCNRLIAQCGDNAESVAATMVNALAYLRGAGDSLTEEQMEQVIEALRSRRGLQHESTDREPRGRDESRPIQRKRVA